MSDNHDGRIFASATDPHVEAVVRSAEREIRELLRQRAELMRRIGTIKQTLGGLADMFGDSILNGELLELLDRRAVQHCGFTRACRAVLMQSVAPLSARQVRDQIQQRFPDLLERHKDPLASITTVLSRLVQYSEARCTVLGPGRRVWQWVAEPADNFVLGETESYPSESAPAGSD
jgi:chorismate mutase